ncbi:MAG: nicotinate-nucleotide adenylyltransferase [Candidatus Magnetomorum sp.]|nr:nicotinate-nucleotide adenylyltransferase [Candidatus Magnetomorum sp.]
MSNTDERLGIFGGTFNPVHFGHLRVAVEVRELFSLDAVIFIPSAQPPHKDQTGIAHASHRLHMTQLAIRSYPFFQVSTIEIQRKGLSYTIDTLKELKKVHPETVQFFYLIGLDAFLSIHTWKHYQKMFDEIPFIVMSRPVSGANKKMSLSMVTNTLVAYIQQTISEKYVHDNQRGCIRHPNKQTIYYCQVTSLDISASQIRRLIENNQSVHFLLPDDVASYITRHKIYKL